jgi:hypothetical protein
MNFYSQQKEDEILFQKYCEKNNYMYYYHIQEDKKRNLEVKFKKKINEHNLPYLDSFYVLNNKTLKIKY